MNIRFGSDMQNQVKEFHEKFGQPIGTAPRFSRAHLRASLILEEAIETAVALLGEPAAYGRIEKMLHDLRHKIMSSPGPKGPDIVEAADGMCDTLYVVLGTAVEMGIDLAPLFDEVHATNMAKEGGPTRADGKILKPEGWQPPRIAQLLVEQANEPSEPSAA